MDNNFNINDIIHTLVEVATTEEVTRDMKKTIVTTYLNNVFNNTTEAERKEAFESVITFLLGL